MTNAIDREKRCANAFSKLFTIGAWCTLTIIILTMNNNYLINESSELLNIFSHFWDNLFEVFVAFESTWCDENKAFQFDIFLAEILHNNRTTKTGRHNRVVAY